MRLVTFETPADQARGLQHISPIDPDIIYLFVGVGAGRKFHTLNVLEPIDIAFLSGDSVVLDLLTLQPGNPGIFSPDGTAAAIEAAGGILLKNGIHPGKSLR